MADPDALVRNLYLVDAGLWVLLYLILARLACIRLRATRSGRLLCLGFLGLALRTILQTTLNRLVLPAVGASPGLVIGLEITFGTAALGLGLVVAAGLLFLPRGLDLLAGLNDRGK
jgi:hypothetical protein